MTNQEFQSLCERPFDPKETIKQIVMFGKEKFFKWDMDRRVTVITDDENESVGMLIKLNHINYSDLILITLDWDDTYHVYFLNCESEKTHDIGGIYFDCLFETIDNHIKKVKVEFCMN